MKSITFALICLLPIFTASAQGLEKDRATTPHSAQARAMLERLVAFRTGPGGHGNQEMARYLQAQFLAAGFSRDQIELIPIGDTAGLIVRYAGQRGSPKAPVVFLAHMDVVDATPSEWSHDPWSLTEHAGNLYGRGIVDNKYGLLTIADAFIRLKREGFIPDRDLIAAFSGDEEAGGTLTARPMAQRLAGAAYAINSDAGGGYRDPDGHASYSLQAAEKTYASFEVTARNKGGHSSMPRPDNAIYELAAALTRLAAYRFPVRWNQTSLEGLRAMGLDGEQGTAIAAFVAEPGNAAAVRVLEQEPWIDRELRTTCVATLLRAGDGEGSLPVTATATINCRIFPGDGVEAVRQLLVATMANDALEVAVLGRPQDSPVSTMPAELRTALDAVLAVRAPGASVSPYIEAGSTDGLHFRLAGIPTIGLGPLISSVGVDYNYHGNDENLPIAHFEDGLDHYYLLIKALASPSANP